MTHDPASLRNWYRQAMHGRADQLRQLLDGLLSGAVSAREEARSIGMALRGSGATFGFPEITDAAALVESARDEDLLRRVEGLIGQLGAVAAGADGDPVDRAVSGPPEWLVRAAGLDDSFRSSWAGGTGWTPVARSAGIDLTELAQRAADYLGIEVADVSDRRSSALRLVPEAFVTSASVVPLREDSETITVVSADPTVLSDEWELELLTGRRPIFAIAPPEAIEAIISRIYGVHGANEAASPAEASAGEGAVLVVDDEPSARLLVRALLERKGYDVIEAEDGLSAIEALEHADVGLVVADLNMPRMDGLELIWALRDAYPSVRPPVIVLTGEADEVLETQLTEEGADDYIQKPIDPRLFLARVESTFRRLGARVSRTPGGDAGG